MAQAINTITVEVRSAWWLRYLYIPALLLFNRTANAIGAPIEWDFEKISRVIMRGIKIKTVR